MVKPTLIPQNNDQRQTIWVVFSNDTDIKILKILKHGFRHCFLIVKDNDQWIVIDPRANKTDFSILPHPSHFNLPRYFSNEGKTVTKLPVIDTPDKIAPIFPMSCVETIKRLIGLHHRWVITPYQLYRALQKIKQKGS
jgi:hypothetical protein